MRSRSADTVRFNIETKIDSAYNPKELGPPREPIRPGARRGHPPGRPGASRVSIESFDWGLADADEAGLAQACRSWRLAGRDVTSRPGQPGASPWLGGHRHRRLRRRRGSGAASSVRRRGRLPGARQPLEQHGGRPVVPPVRHRRHGPSVPTGWGSRSSPGRWTTRPRCARWSPTAWTASSRTIRPAAPGPGRSEGCRCRPGTPPADLAEPPGVQAWPAQNPQVCGHGPRRTPRFAGMARAEPPGLREGAGQRLGAVARSATCGETRGRARGRARGRSRRSRSARVPGEPLERVPGPATCSRPGRRRRGRTDHGVGQAAVALRVVGESGVAQQEQAEPGPGRAVEEGVGEDVAAARRSPGGGRGPARTGRRSRRRPGTRRPGARRRSPGTRAVRASIEAARAAATPVSGPSPSTIGHRLAEADGEDLGRVDEGLRARAALLGDARRARSATRSSTCAAARRPGPSRRRARSTGVSSDHSAVRDDGPAGPRRRAPRGPGR